MNVTTKPISELKEGEVLEDYKIISWQATIGGETDVTYVEIDGSFCTDYDVPATQEVKILDFEPHPFFAALSKWCIAVANEMYESSMDDPVLDEIFEIDLGHFIVRDRFFNLYQYQDGTLDCVSHRINEKS